VEAGSANGRDDILRDGQAEFGANLHIPYVFVCVETILPRMLSNRPRMLWSPRDELSSQNTENMRWLCDQQQQKMDYELTLQTTGKAGLVQGFAVQKGMWRRVERDVWMVVPNELPTAENPSPYVRARELRVLYDDPDFIDVDAYDFLWDPAAHNARTMEFCIHRTWRSTRYVRERFAAGDWNLIAEAREWTAEEIEGMGGGVAYTDVHQGRQEAAGLGSRRLPSGRHVHEVWEYHDGVEIVTVLNREWPVARRENPAWLGDLPFHIYRPTEVNGQMVGKGEPEPLEDLSDEMDTMRSQRRDNASLKLATSYFYQDGAFDPKDLAHGAGVYNPVNSLTSLRDAIMPMNVGDIPNSSYQEEAALQADIERVTGLSDAGVGASSSGETATGAQLTNAAANVRIQLKTRRLELETITPAARQMLQLNQQHILEQRDVRVPTTPSPREPDRVWAWLAVGPAELRGDWEIEADGGSTAPINVPQDRNDAQMLMTGFGQHPDINQRALLEEALKRAGIRRPERLLNPADYVPPKTLEFIYQGLVGSGMRGEVAEQFIGDALRAAKMQEEGGPDAPLAPPEEGPGNDEAGG
jgi:hypothetical protein